ncbi:hypothetical protein GGX14DRAFT_372486, partial [Mycena pura]
ARLQKAWKSSAYAFFTQDVKIELRKGKQHHVFTCAAKGCNHRVARNLTTKDSNSTKSLLSHARHCWGKDTVDAALAVKSAEKAREILRRNPGKQKRLTDIFKHHANSTAEIFSARPLTKAENRCCLRPFRIVKDRAYRYLMKSGRPGVHIPSPSTIARDVKKAFAKTRERVKERLSTVTGITLITDAWTSPNHRAFVAVGGSWEEDGRKVECLLDFIEVPKVRVSKHVQREYRSDLFFL